MSMRYPGGLIATSPVNARYPSGVWTQAQAAPYQAQNVWTRDQFWPNTTLLLQGDGAVNGAQNNTFLDSSSNNFTITRNGNTTQGSFTPYEQDGYWSNYFDGNGDYLTAPNNTALDLSTGDFTVEFWFYPTVGNQSAAMVNRHNGNYSTPNDFQFGVYLSSGNLVVRPYQGTTDYTTVVGAAQTNAWNHAAFVRTGNTFYGFLNGVRGTTSQTISGALNNSTWATYLGAALSASLGNDFFTGYLSNVRIVKGTALYTSSFTPSAAPLTAITNTSLLTCQSNRFKDNSTNNFTLTVNGNTSVQAFQPFPGATTWSASVLGGSGYFDGDGDYLTAAQNAAFSLGTGAFTVEAWVYLTANNLYNRIIGLGIGASGSAPHYTAWALQLINLNPSWYRFDGTETAYTSSSTASLNTWNHVVVVRDGSSNFAMFLNGVRVFNQTVSLSYNAVNSDDLYVGRTTSGGGTPSTTAGYISDTRVVKGSAVYDPTQSTLTVPTAPLTAITNTSLLLSTTNAGIYDNSMMNNLETVGNAQVSTSVVKYGTGSMSFVRSPSSYLVANNSTRLLSLGTGDWTVEAWVYMNTLPAGNGYPNSYWIVGGGPSNSDTGFDIAIGSTNLQVGLTTFLSLNINTAHGMVANTWYHVAVVRFGATLYAFINGSQLATASVSGVTVDPCLTGLAISAAEPTGATSGNFNGYIDDLRITKAARYITNFTPPPARMPGQ